MSIELLQITTAAWIPRGEELANSISHGLGLLGSIAAIPILVIAAADRGGPIDVVGSSIFGVSMVFLYLASTWYHLMPVGKVKDRLQRVDHAAIYVLIAGTYTPFTFGVLGGVWGWDSFWSRLGKCCYWCRRQNCLRCPVFSLFNYHVFGHGVAGCDSRETASNCDANGGNRMVASRRALLFVRGFLFYRAQIAV